jgi:O-antigen ligase
LFEDSDIRVGLDVIGSKESVYTYVLIPFVYAFGLYFIQMRIPLWEKMLYMVSILSIYLSLVYSFNRSNLLTIFIITFYFVITSKKVSRAVGRVVAIGILIGVCLFIFGGILSKRGYDPVKKIIETAEFATDITNPDWDKGRHISQEVALVAWQRNLWTGAGYDELYNYGMPDGVASAHNGIITSLFHRGIIGTSIFLLILFLLFRNSIKLWRIVKKEDTYQNDMIKLLIVVAFFWIIPYMTEEATWEKYSLSIEYMYLGFISNIYRQITA